MSRRRSSVFEDLVELAARLPWWLCLVLAALAYLGFGALAATPLQVTGKPDASLIYGSSLRGAALAAKIAVPLLLVVAAGVSALRRLQARKLVETARAAGPQAAVDGMSWAEFERLIGELFRERGYRVEETGGGGADGGVDLVLFKGGEKFLVQCKQWRAFKVGVSVVRELYGVMAARGAAGGFVVTSGVFTDEARAFAQGRNVTLMDGAALAKYFAAGARPVESPAPRSAPPPAAAAAAEPTCPNCSASMVLRKAQRGANAGQTFWGCSRYPQCRGTRPRT